MLMHALSLPNSGEEATNRIRFGSLTLSERSQTLPNQHNALTDRFPIYAAHRVDVVYALCFTDLDSALSRALLPLRVLFSSLKGKGHASHVIQSSGALSLSLVERFMLLFMLFIQNSVFFACLLTGKWQPIYFSGSDSGCVEKGNAEFFFFVFFFACVAFDLFVCLRRQQL